MAVRGVGGVGGVSGVGGVGMVPVQVPVSVANGHTVYQTVHLPMHAPHHLQIIPQLQQVTLFLIILFKNAGIALATELMLRSPIFSSSVPSVFLYVPIK